MAAVTLTNVVVLDNPATFTSPFRFEVTFECIQSLADDLEWKLIYVGSAEDESYDQVLEELLVGPVPVGTNRFILQAPGPDPRKIPVKDLLSVTVVLITCSYRGKEFVRVGYYVNNGYPGQEGEGEDGEACNPLPSKIELDLIQRSILADKPRVTRFPIDWNSSPDADPLSMEEADAQAALELAERDDEVYLDEEDDDGEESEEDADMVDMDQADSREMHFS